MPYSLKYGILLLFLISNFLNLIAVNFNLLLLKLYQFVRNTHNIVCTKKGFFFLFVNECNLFYIRIKFFFLLYRNRKLKQIKQTNKNENNENEPIKKEKGNYLTSAIKEK